MHRSQNGNLKKWCKQNEVWLFTLLDVGRRLNVILCLFQIPDLAQVYLIGFYEEKDFSLYISALSNELKVPVR